MKLTDKAIFEIKGHTRLKNRLALDFNRSVHTIERWIQENDVMLTTAAALAIIREETGLTDEQILETEETGVSETGR